MKIIGVMTGNSLDGCDLILTEFLNGEMKDLSFFSQNIPETLQKKITILKKQIKKRKILSKNLLTDSFFLDVHDGYIRWVASVINEFLKKENVKISEIDLIGFHGQTLDHNPPSVATDRLPYTLQMGSGQMLSNLLSIPVVYDFRSDDIFFNGEGAPLMPPHNVHFAKSLGLKNAFFYNAGNTSNLALVVNGEVVLGFDAGPFNEFTDYLVRKYKKEPFDKDAFWAKQGTLLPFLFEKLFYQSVKTSGGENYLEFSPPKSADPTLYHLDNLLEIKTEQDFVDTLHTVAYFSGYIAAYALKHIDDKYEFPDTFILFGGGWYNPISYQAFVNTLNGSGYILEEHKKIFEKIVTRFKNFPHFILPTSAKYMEARLMADLAYHFEKKLPWTNKELTGVEKPVVLGIKATPNRTTKYTDYINRASEGWQLVKEANPQ